jgi:ribonuclease HI
MIKIYVDGCCLNNQEKENKGGWSFVAILHPDGETIEKVGCKINTTNQQMELISCIEAMFFSVEIGEKNVEIFSDSAYVVNCVKDGWYLKWIRNNWKNSKNEPVKNQELWKIFIELLEFQYFKFTHIRGHSGNIYNDRADQLAKFAARCLEKGNDYNEQSGTL